MSCNAWNHSFGCNCGWGGAFYGAAYRDDGGGTFHWQRSASYTTPNAKCPKCSAKVFFYKSPFGGRVYFDDLGPPWPKHPCMDSTLQGVPRNAVTTSAVESKFQAASSVPREPGWKPMICNDLRRHKRCREVTVMTIHNGSSGANTLFAVVDRAILVQRTPFLARLKENGVIEVSTLNALAVEPHEVRFNAFLSPHDLPSPFKESVVGGKISLGHKAVPKTTRRSRVIAAPLQVSKKMKPARIDPASVPVTYKHKHIDRFPTKETSGNQLKNIARKSRTEGGKAKQLLAVENEGLARVNAESPEASLSNDVVATALAIALEKVGLSKK